MCAASSYGSGRFADSVEPTSGDGIQTVHSLSIFIVEGIALDSIFVPCKFFEYSVG